MNKKLGVGVVIGRYHTPDLTPGHLKTIATADQHSILVVLLGCAPLVSKKNALDFPTRKLMVQRAFPNAIILPLFDKYDDQVWAEQLDSLLENLFEFQSITLYGSRDSFAPKYKGKFKVELVEEVPKVNATDLRTECASEPLSTPDFRKGIIYSVYNDHARVNPTVDICIHRKIKNQFYILLGRKSFAPTAKYVFAGGFVDASDTCLQSAAAREIYEECQISCSPNDLKFITSTKVKDWRSTEDNTVMTTFFGLSWPKGKNEPKAGDDLREVKWFELDETEEYISPQHSYLCHRAKLFLKGN